MTLCDGEKLAMEFNEDESLDYWDERAEPNYDVRMLRTCKEIYREAILVLFTRNTFKFDSYKLLSIFTSKILPQRFASIRQVVLNITLFWYRGDGFAMPYEDSLTLLSRFRSLKDICLRYRLRENNYVNHPCLDDFTLLAKLEQDERSIGYAMFCEMLEVQTEPEIGRMLFERWAVGERRMIHTAK